MKNTLIKIRNYIISFLYRNILKRIFFKIDEETIHDKTIKIGRILGSNIITREAVSYLFNFFDSALRQNILGMNFKNPVGLSAGFDKNAELTKIMPSIGFGFMEIGSVTGEFCAGNPKPRLWRMPKSRSIVVYYGLKNDGCEAISERLQVQRFKIPIGISIAKTNSLKTVDPEAGTKDYIKAIRAFLNIGDYFTINISCPNTFGGQPFHDPQFLEPLLIEINKIDVAKPIFLKITPDLSFEDVDKIIELSDRHNISGFVCANLTKNRNNQKIIQEEIVHVPEGIGGISGKPVEEMTNNLISYIYKKTKGKYVIIGCGGVFEAEDAYKKIRLGASLIQMITGMIFEGPQIISQINLGLCELLKKDGFKNISEAVGLDGLR